MTAGRGEAEGRCAMKEQTGQPAPPLLRHRQWKRFPRGPDPGLLEELYEPALRCAVRYDRCCAYFSSSVLAAAARGFAGFIQNLLRSGPDACRPAARLLVNEQLDEADLRALLSTAKEDILADSLLKRFRDPSEALQKHRLQMLAWLVREGWLEVRVGIMRDGQGIMHAKFGLVTDSAGDCLAFQGSGNETGEALTSNYEELEVRSSWDDAEFVQHFRARFDSLWSDGDPAVRVLSLPEAVREKLIRFAPAAPPEREPRPEPAGARVAALWRFLNVSPFLPQGETVSDATAPVELWPHQRRVVEDVCRAFPAGRLLCDEVGMGKTIEAAVALRRLWLGRGVRYALLLVPAGLLRQWQEELREKAGLQVPFWDSGFLYPDGSPRKPMEAREALEKCEVLLLSREWARLPANREVVLSAREWWDLVLMDEAHAARRKEPDENAFNEGNLLLELLRELQLGRRTRGILLLSATPMQTEPWEPWDLLTTLGVGGPWMVEFEDIRAYYRTVADLEKDAPLSIDPATEERLRELVGEDHEFPPCPAELGGSPGDAVRRLPYALSQDRKRYAGWLRESSPLGRRMHRNTRDTLRQYHSIGLLQSAPPRRRVEDVIYDYEDERERRAYDAISTYIHNRYLELEKEKKGKGFVMTVYRRRASSSPEAIRRSLERRARRLEALVNLSEAESWLNPWDEDVDLRDLADEDIEKIDAGLPAKGHQARGEKEEIEKLLSEMELFRGIDSKLNRLWDVLRDATADGRSVLVFTEYRDTMEYLRDQLAGFYGQCLACYSGEGGEVYDGSRWQKVPKAEITTRLSDGRLQVLVCTDAASEGLNLQAAGALVNYDLPWNPSKVEQRIGRIDRIGQKHPEIRVYNLFLKDSVDTRVYQALRTRCRLFEHFVGPMQPVLARAGKALRDGLDRKQQEALLRELERESSRVRDDVLVTSTFISSPAEQPQSPQPAVTRDDLEDALSRLDGKAVPVKAVRLPDRRAWKVTRVGNRPRTVTVRAEELERDETVSPLVPGKGLFQEIASRLEHQAAVPLVCVEVESGPYRCAEARWVGSKSIERVKDLARLKALLERWDGSPPDPELRTRAEREARGEAERRLRQMCDSAHASVEAALERQLDAARRRLKRELVRTLLLINPTSDPAATLRSLAAREAASVARFRKALELLGPDAIWSPAEVAEARRFVKSLGANERESRLTYTEIDAALKDPRWKALRSSGSS